MMVGSWRLERQTFAVSRRRSNQLSYEPKPKKNARIGRYWALDQSNTLILLCARYLDTVEVWRSSRHGPTIQIPDQSETSRALRN